MGIMTTVCINVEQGSEKLPYIKTISIRIFTHSSRLPFAAPSPSCKDFFSIYKLVMAPLFRKCLVKIHG